MVDARTAGRRNRVILGGLALALIIAAGSIGLRAFRGDGEAPAIAPAAAGNVDGAIASLEARLTATPEDAEGWRMLGWSYFQTGRHGDAVRAYQKAVRLQPKQAALWSALGEARTLAVNAVDAPAHQAFTRALAIDPKDARARYFLGVEKDVAGQHEAAVADWIALLKDSPPGAPYAQSVRELIVQVSQREEIDLGDRLPAATAELPLGGDIASAGIPGPTSEQMQAAATMSPSQQDAMARGMVDGLAQRLARNPRDAEGWIRLMRARMVLGDSAAAGVALASARRAFAGDAATLVRLEEAAQTLAIKG